MSHWGLGMGTGRPGCRLGATEKENGPEGAVVCDTSLNNLEEGIKHHG